MEAKDTVMSDKQIEILKQEAEKLAWSHKVHPYFEEERHLLEAQAAISFQAGRREAVEFWKEEQLKSFGRPVTPDAHWVAKLKEWGIEVD